MTNHTNDIKTDDQFLMHDAIEDAKGNNYPEHPEQDWNDDVPEYPTHDAIEDVRLDGASHEDVPVWIENEDGSGQWSDGWTGDDEFEPEYPSDDDAFFCYEDGDEWLGSGGSCETGDWIGPSDADPGL